MSSIDEKLKAIRTNLDLKSENNNRKLSYCHSLLRPYVKGDRWLKLENTYIQYIGHQANRTRSLKTIPLNNADITIIASNIPQEPEENILEISKELIIINPLNEYVDVVAAA